MDSEALEPVQPSRHGSSRAIPVVVALLVFSGLVTRLTGIALERKALAVSLGLGLLVWLIRAATPAGAAMGTLLTAAMLTMADSPSLWAAPLTKPLLLLCVLTIGATRFGRRRKQRLGLAESRKGRSASQIAANLGTAALAANLAHAHVFYAVGAVAALVEATSDTLSSEIGQVFGGRTLLLTTLRAVPPGTDGGVSLSGSLAGLVGGAAIALAAYASGLSAGSAAIALVAGLFGWIADSALGATIERRGWLSNDGVNFTSTLIAAILGACLELRLHPLPVLLH